MAFLEVLSTWEETIECTIADLVDDIRDLSLVSNTLRDASLRGTLDQGRLAQLLAPLSARTGLPTGDGAAPLTHLEAVAGIDSAAIASRLTADAVLGPLVTADFLQRTNLPDHLLDSVLAARWAPLERASRSPS